MSQLRKSVQYAYWSTKIAQAKHAPTGFNSKIRYQKLAIAVRVIQKTQNLANSYCFFAEDGKEMYKKIYNARAQQLICSLNLLFGDVLVVVAIIMFAKTPY